MRPISLVRRWSFVDELHRLMVGTLDPHAVVDQVCDRIDEVDDRVEAFVAEPRRRDRMHEAAAQVIDRWPNVDGRPQLFGAPIAIKDMVHVDSLPTTAGSFVPSDELSGVQAAVVDRLLAAGAVVAGKTVTAEFANIAPGPTRNPQALEHTPGGSSSGSAAAVAAGMVPFAIGTQTIGSVIRPAAYCGIVGYKPTFGRVPVDGVIPHSPSLDTIGAFAADVGGVTLLAGVLLDGWSIRDAAAPHTPASNAPTSRPVFGIADGPYLEQADATARSAVTSAGRRLRDAGFDIRSAPVIDDVAEINLHNFVISRFELANVHDHWFARHHERYRPETRHAIEEGQAITRSEYDESLEHCLRFRTELESRMHDAGVDLLLCPSSIGPAPSGLDSTGNALMNLPWSYGGAPAVTLPIKRAPNGLPLGLQLVAAPRRDEHLLATAATIEPLIAPA